MAPCKRQVKAKRHLVCDHCHSWVDFALSGCGKSWAETMEEGFTFQCIGCWKVECLQKEIVRLTDIVKGMEIGISKEAGRMERDDRERGENTARLKENSSGKKTEERRLRGGKVIGGEEIGKSTTENVTSVKVTGKKVTVEKEGGKMGGRGERKTRWDERRRDERK